MTVIQGQSPDRKTDCSWYWEGCGCSQCVQRYEEECRKARDQDVALEAMYPHHAEPDYQELLECGCRVGSGVDWD